MKLLSFGPWFFVLFLALPRLGFASPHYGNSNPVFGDNFGVNIKIARITETEIGQIAKLGIRSVRTGIDWHEVEREAGHYRWNLPLPRDREADDFNQRKTFTYDEMMERFHRHGLHVSVVLGEGNTLYTGPAVSIPWFGTTIEAPPAPRTAEAIRAFAAFTAATASHYSGLYGTGALTWLIWNEPDFDFNYPPKTDGAVVGKLVETACRKIKYAVPGARVMGPSLSVSSEGHFHYAFIRDLFAIANPLRCLDGFTLHPYRPGPPESAPADYIGMEAFLSPWQPANPVPIAVDEWGVTTSFSSIRSPSLWWRSYTEEEQAALQLRMYLVNLAFGIPYTAIYEWRDSGANPDEPEDNYGMTAFDGREKPAIRMLRHVWPRLSGRAVRAETKLAGCDDRVHAFRFADPFQRESDIWMAWTEGVSKHLTVDEGYKSATDIFGQPVAPIDRQEERLLPIGGIPIMLFFDNANSPAPGCRD